MPRISLSILILFLLSAGTISALVGNQNPTSQQPRDARQAIPSHNTRLGFDCGLGTTSAVVNATGVPVAPSELNPALSGPQSRCTWIGDAGQTISGANDGTVEPLVGDQDESLSLVSPVIGGGFTANVVVFQNSTAQINGFDLRVAWNPAILRMVEFDQTGLSWRSSILVTAVQTFDNTNGVAELAQVISGTVSGNLTLFRIRFDVVGVGVTNLNLVNVSGGLANPSPVVHDTLNGSFDSESYYDPSQTLNWIASFHISPNPPTPGSPITFTADATCPGCAAPFSYSWDFSSTNTNPPKVDATGQSVTITPPPITVNRVTLNITDSTSHSVTVTQQIPLAVIIRNAPASTGSLTTFSGLWLGGTPAYTLLWRICPGTPLNKAVCSNPNPSAQLNGQANNQSVTFNYSGLYNVSLAVSDNGQPVNSAKAFTELNVTGAPSAYSVILSSQSNPSGGFTFGASVAYNNNYPATLQSVLFSYTFNFGDFASQTIIGSASVSAQHTYSTVGTFQVNVIVKEVSSRAPSQIIETAQTTVSTTGSFDYSIGLSPSSGSIATGGSVSSLVVLNTLSGSPENVRLQAIYAISGASVAFNITSGTPPFSSIMVVSTTSTTPPGSYSIIVEANSTSGIVRETVFTLQVGTVFTGPIIGVWSSHYNSANVTDTGLTAGSAFSVQVNVTNAPFTGWNGYEFVLYYDQRYIKVASFDIFTGTIFGSTAFQGPGTYNGPGALRLSVVDEGHTFADSGMLVNITFVVVKAGGVSPLVLAAGMAETGQGASASGSCPYCPPGAPNWSRLLAGSTLIGVETSDGYFKNEASSSGPVAEFTYSPLNPSQGTFVTFNATGSFDPDNAGSTDHGIATYFWDFGDISDTPNITTTSPVVTHRFFHYSGTSGTSFYGNFSIRLVVIDSDSGFEGIFTGLVTIAQTGSHDLAVTRLTPVPQTVSQGGTEGFIVEVTNHGDSLETYNLTISYGPANQTLRTLATLTQQLILTGGINSYQFSLNTSGLSQGLYTVMARVSDTLDTNPANDAMTSHFLISQQDESPTASFTLAPSNPVAGRTVAFDASTSFDPDGTITNYYWMFGDGVTYSDPFPSFHYSYLNPGNYTVTLTVTDSSGLSGSTTTHITVLPAPEHDVQLLFVTASSPVITGQTVFFYLAIVSNGTQSSIVNVTVYYSGNVATTAHGLMINQGYPNYPDLQWITTGVAPGNYTISATVFLAGDPTPSDNTLTDGQVVILPLPVITATPATGPVGTTVTLHGSGFIPVYPYSTSNQFLITFDNQLVGYASGNTSFTFTFNVPLAQAGPHQIHAIQQNYPSNLDTQTSFTVTASPGSLTISVTTGTIYFPGDTVTIFIQTNLNGQSTTPTSIQAVLLRPGNQTTTLTLTMQTTGVYKTTYTVPSTGPVLGTYAVIVKIHQTGTNDAQTITSFEVKLTWLASNGKNITTAAAITGLVGVAALAWYKGYYRRKDNDSPAPI